MCIILDGVGVGNSVGNTARWVGSLRLPVMQDLGLGNIIPIAGVTPSPKPAACYGKMTPVSAGKDSTSGHWEITGCLLDRPFPTYPHGFPPEVMGAFERAIGRGSLGNKPASGTEIIESLGAEHMRTGSPIVYTSQDSVFQIAAHEDVIPIDELYRMCGEARSILKPPHAVARVIARPFVGKPGRFHRSERRRDFSLEPPQSTVLDGMVDDGHRVLVIGKVADLFAGRGISESVPTKRNEDGMAATLDAAKRAKRAQRRERGLVLTNLVDFDTMWGHRNDARAYALGLEEFDSWLVTLLDALAPETLLMITSDHGNDPTTPSTDHSREYVPLLCYHTSLTNPCDLGTRATFADVGKTIADNFSLSTHASYRGESFLSSL